MSLTPPGSQDPAEFLCLMPSRNSTESQTARTDLDEHVDLDPVQSWAALSHLDGKCLYERLGWFTYSYVFLSSSEPYIRSCADFRYCHNSHVRQFRAAKARHPHSPGGYEPEEDPHYDAYTLGQAYQETSSRKTSLKARDRSNQKSLKSIKKDKGSVESPVNSVSFAQTAASRYLVQKWSDGTMCDKTGRPREVEVQFHCSMTGTDTIYLVKEMAICQYVVIIHSPHLCGLPGFRAPHADVEPAGIRCRQVIPDEDFEKWITSRTGHEQSGDLSSPWKTIRQPVTDKVRFAWDEMSVDEVTEKQTKGASEHQTSVEAEVNLGDPLDWGAVKEKELQDFLEEWLSPQAARGHADGDDVIFLAVEQDEEGNILLEPGVLGGEGQNGMDLEAQAKLMRALKDFLKTKALDKGVDDNGEEVDQEIVADYVGEGDDINNKDEGSFHDEL